MHWYVNEDPVPTLQLIMRITIINLLGEAGDRI